jgi:hypothetical protein
MENSGSMHKLESTMWIMLFFDLGFDVNVLPKKRWEMMGEPELVWSPI